MKFREAPNIELLYEGARVTLRFDPKDNVDAVHAFNGINLDEEYDITIKKRSGKRSLNANNYHWLICEQMAKVLRLSKYHVHNQLMIDYGTDWLDESGDHVYVLMKDNDRYLKLETTHYRPTDATEERNGVMYRWFVLLLPSHLMDSAQMAALIDGTIQEAKELNIDTRTPDEIERMKQLWANNTQAL